MKAKHFISLAGIIQVTAVVVSYMAVRSLCHTWEKVAPEMGIAVSYPTLGLWWRDYGLFGLLVPAIWASIASWGYYRDIYPFSDERLITISGMTLCFLFIFGGIVAFIRILSMTAT